MERSVAQALTPHAHRAVGGAGEEAAARDVQAVHRRAVPLQRDPARAQVAQRPQLHLAVGARRDRVACSVDGERPDAVGMRLVQRTDADAAGQRVFVPRRHHRRRAEAAAAAAVGVGGRLRRCGHDRPTARRRRHRGAVPHADGLVRRAGDDGGAAARDCVHATFVTRLRRDAREGVGVPRLRGGGAEEGCERRGGSAENCAEIT